MDTETTRVEFAHGQTRSTEWQLTAEKVLMNERVKVQMNDYKKERDMYSTDGGSIRTRPLLRRLASLDPDDRVHGLEHVVPLAHKRREPRHAELGQLLEPVVDDRADLQAGG